MGRYPTGVSMVASKGADGPVGMIVGTFGSVSLDPPLVSFMPAKTSTTWPLIEQAGSFAINVLSVEQEAVCRAFRGDHASRFAGEPWREGLTGSPILERAAAWIDCSIESVFDAGDHFIVLGRVVALDSPNTKLPLLFFQGGYGSFSPGTMVTTEVDLPGNLAFIDYARPLMESLSRLADCECVLGKFEHKNMLIMASAGTRKDSKLSTLVGERIPVVAPFGRTAMAWAPESEVEAWATSKGPEHRDRYKQMLSSIRQRGYSVTVEADQVSGSEASHAVAVLDPGVESGSEGGTTAGTIHSITAPVINDLGAAEFVLGLYGVGKVAPELLEEAIQALGAVTAELEQYLRKSAQAKGTTA